VALGIIKLLPVELVVSGGVGAGLAMVLALLAAAIVWNLGTWSLGLPASSSHTLIGAILGVGLANSLIGGHHIGDGVNWAKAGETGVALVVSPLFGFTAAGLMVAGIRYVMRRMNHPALARSPVPGRPPPPLVRALLVATCSGVSFAHGSNDGQKGVGLVMLILMGLAPAGFALDMSAGAESIGRVDGAARRIAAQVEAIDLAAVEKDRDEVLALTTLAQAQLTGLTEMLAGNTAMADIGREHRFLVRQAILVADKAVDTLIARGVLDGKAVKDDRKTMRSLTDYAPQWVLVAIALSLGVGTMIGWKRIVVTVGEKIGKQHLTYAQGASAELVATATIGLSAGLGLPVSTTHVLSSGVAGTMVAQGAGVQGGTVRNIAAAWILTLPVSMLLAGVFYLGFRFFFV
jgi:PiT family inorganic phosphate transporter